MRRKTKAIIVLMFAMTFTNGIDLHSQNKEEQLLDATTAQGLWVQFNPNKNDRFERLSLAQSKVFGKEQRLSFENVFSNDDFVSFLQLTNGFAVISAVPKGLKFEDKLFAIDEWVADFEFDPAQPIESRPVLIFKFAPSSISKLANNKNMIYGLTTSGNLETVQVYIEKVKRKLISNKDYTHINKILNDPDWTGIIGINLKVDNRSLPADLQVAAESMGRKQIPWDHVGFSLQASNTDNRLMPAFGLIDYEFTQGDQQSDDQTIPYWMLQLSVVFEHSAIKKFISKIELNLDYTTSFWSKKGRDFNDYELQYLLDSESKIYTIEGICQLNNGAYFYSFTGEDRQRPVGPLLESLQQKVSH